MCVRKKKKEERKNPITRDQALDDATNDKDNSLEKDNSMQKSHPSVIDIDTAIIVSDLHLGYEKCNAIWSGVIILPIIPCIRFSLDVSCAIVVVVY
jgi:hypothetical protein